MLKKVLKAQAGQGVLEYIILASLIGIFCLVAVKQFGEVIQSRIIDMRKHVVDKIELRQGGRN